MIKFEKWNDKNWHMVAGTIITVFLGVLCFWFVDDRMYVSMIFGLVCGSLAGVLKELFDMYFKKTSFNTQDLMATIWGSLVGVVVLAPILANI